MQELRSNPRERSAVVCRETAQRDMREETVVENAYEGKPGRRGGKAESWVGGGAIIVAYLCLHSSNGS